MFEYVRRGITRRKRQTAIISIGMALAVAAVLVISAASNGIAAAQNSVLQAVYGVGTDLTITSSPTRGDAQSGDAESGGGGMQFGPEAGQTGSDGSTDISSTQVSVARGTQTMDSTVLDTVSATSGVSAATATLSLTQTDFSGTIQQQESSGTDSSGTDSQDQGGQGGPGQGGGAPGGFGGGSFDLDQTTIMGVDPSATDVGPLSDMTVSSGALLSADDTDSAVISATYASDNSIAVGDTVTLGTDTTATVVGILSEESSQSASDIYVPLSVAQTLADEDGAVTTIYVKAASADDVDTLADALATALPDETVSTQSDLASTVSGSLSSAASWISGFGKWLTIGILALAFLLASLFTISSVTRRTRELGTLKAIGWSNTRVLGNVVAETLIQAVIGGVVGLALGVAAVIGINAAGITLGGSASATGGMPTTGQGAPGSTDTGSAPTGGGAPGDAAGPGAVTASATSTTTTLHLDPSLTAVGLGVGASLLGGVVAGGAGAIKVSKLRPAAALRSVD